MSVKMMRYKQAEFADDNSSSLGSIVLNSDAIDTSATHVRYHSGISIWKSRSLLERCLLITCASLLFMLILIIMAVSYRFHGWKNQRYYHLAPQEEACVTGHCVTVAASLINNMDTTVDPCDNFYEYACGGWIKKNPIPEGKSMWGTFGKLEQDNQLVIKNVIEKNMTEMKSDAEKKAKDYYESCMDPDERIEQLGGKPLLDFLDQVGGWAALGSKNFNDSAWSFQETFQALQNVYNMGGLFVWYISEDDRNSSRHIIQLDQGGLTLPTTDNYLNNTKVLTAYLDYMTKIGVLLGGEEMSTRKHMSDVIDFEKKIASITTPQEERRDEEKLYNLMDLEKLQNLAPFMSWHLFFENATRLINDSKLIEGMHVVNYAPAYFSNLTVIVNGYLKSRSGKVILDNYLKWQTVRSMTSCLSKPFRDAYKVLRKALLGTEGFEEQWRFCVSDTNNLLGLPVGAMFVREVFHGKSKLMAENMINEIRNAFKENLVNLRWMDPETRRLAEEKADAITDMIGFPDFILISEQLDERYKGLSIRKDEYFQNNIRINQFSLVKNLEKLKEPVNKTAWIMSPSTVNAYYTPTKNQIVFPAGILQTPFFDMVNPSSLNFGGMGVVMGHELTHAFDDQGREYDLKGNLHQWWNSTTIERFKQRTECFISQYGKFRVGDRNVNGKQTLGENIADNGGLKAAYHAYRSLSKSEGDQLLLPGLNLTHNQLFFLNFAQVWCSAVTPEAVGLQIDKDTHCPANFRVIGPLSNMKEFSEVFNCPRGSKMNPVEKCEVW